jgi:hypothetical protein
MQYQMAKVSAPTSAEDTKKMRLSFSNRRSFEQDRYLLQNQKVGNEPILDIPNRQLHGNQAI